MSASPTDSVPASAPLSLGYQTPGTPTGARLWGVAMLFIAGLSMIVFGGCFLIGVLLMCRPDLIFAAPPVPPNPPILLSLGGEILVTVLYVATFTCFLAATWLLLLAVRGVLRVIEGASS